MIGCLSELKEEEGDDVTWIEKLAPKRGFFYIFCNFWKFGDFLKIGVFGLFGGPGGPGAFKIVFRILKYPGGLIYSFGS